MADKGAYGIVSVPPTTPGAIVCGSCGRAWMEDITPAGRCAFEELHEAFDEDVCVDCGYHFDDCECDDDFPRWPRD